MTRREKADPAFLQRIADWEGTPDVSLPLNYMTWLRSEFVPVFHICAYGPIPMGQAERCHLQIDNLVVRSYEEAEQEMWGYIQAMSDQWAGYTFDSDDWEIAHVHLSNGN